MRIGVADVQQAGEGAAGGGGELVAVGAFHAVDQAVVAEQAADFSGVAADVGGVRFRTAQGFAEVAISQAVPGEFAAQQVLGQLSVGSGEGLQAAPPVAVVCDGFRELVEDLAEGGAAVSTPASDSR